MSDGQLSGGKGREILESEVERKVIGEGQENGAMWDVQHSGGKSGFESEVRGQVIVGKDGGLSEVPLPGGKEQRFLGGKDKRGKGEFVEVNDGGRVEEVKARSGRVRRATFADLDAIMDINDNIYDGTDYFPAYFYIFMHSKQYAIYVYELDGKLVRQLL